MVGWRTLHSEDSLLDKIKKKKIKYKIYSYSIRKPVHGALSTNVLKQVFNMTPVAYITSMNFNEFTWSPDRYLVTLVS